MGQEIIEDNADRIMVREWSGEKTLWRRLGPDLYELAEPTGLPLEHA
ncbi:MAG TPA: hypothetical protein VMB50_20705 [Myxococcales bacterium]|nr:hypothetical protein [Myxococcales bacterium]